MTLWSGRFDRSADQGAFDLNTSLPFDQRMAAQDVRGSQAWAAAIHQAGIIDASEHTQIAAGLADIAAEFTAGDFDFSRGDEDIHSAVERRLTELIGPVAGKLHTGRSRNDQVATDFRLWLLDHMPQLANHLAGLQQALIERAKNDLGQAMAGYTHLQPAQPLLLSHWWLSHFWPLSRDQERLMQCRQRLSSLPLGSGALAGVPFRVDRQALANELGFSSAAPNSIDAVSDRDFAAEFLFTAALIGTHLSRLAENMVIFTSPAYGYFQLSDAYSTGSSLMPQKKNPDHFELARGKAGTLLGYLVGLLTTLKGLPSTYDKDLQEDKIPVFAAMDTLNMLLPVLSGALESLTINPDRLDAAIEPAMFATEMADYLVARGLPFRQAHEVTGSLVRLAETRNVPLDAITAADLQKQVPEITIDAQFQSIFEVEAALDRRSVRGGTGIVAVSRQLQEAEQNLNAQMEAYS